MFQLSCFYYSEWRRFRLQGLADPRPKTLNPGTYVPDAAAECWGGEEDPKTFDAYLQAMAKRSVWADGMILTALAERLGSSIIIGEDFPRLCNDEPVSPGSETWQALQKTELCSGANVEHDAVGEEEAMLRVRQAVHLGLVPGCLATCGPGALGSRRSGPVRVQKLSHCAPVEGQALHPKP